MKVILHIGVEKTGTTSIQRFMAANPDKLKSCCATRYVDRILDFTNQCTELVVSSVERPGSYLEKFRNADITSFREKVKAKLASIIALAVDSSLTQLIFSSEFMTSRIRNYQELELLKGLFPNDVDFEIVVYCRRQDEMYLGTLSEGVKAGVVLDEPLDKKIELEDGFYSRSYYDFHALLEMWSAVFGKQNIRVNVFERSQLKAGDAVSDFFIKTLGVEDLSGWRPSEGRQLNRRLSAEFLYFLSNFNKTHDYSDRELLLKYAETIDTFSSNTLVPVSRLREFLNSFEASNHRVAQEYLNRKSLFNQNTIADDDYIVADRDSLLRSTQIIEGGIVRQLFQ